MMIVLLYARRPTPRLRWVGRGCKAFEFVGSLKWPKELSAITVGAVLLHIVFYKSANVACLPIPAPAPAAG